MKKEAEKSYQNILKDENEMRKSDWWNIKSNESVHERTEEHVRITNEVLT